jgi:hypothetical protein
MGIALCRRCGGSWCSTCLVYAFGPKKPPYCMSCAMVAGGVRTSASLPAMPKRQLKAQMKAIKAQQKAEAKAAARAEAPTGEPEVSPESERELAEAFSQTDWSSPWWEDRQPTMAD